MTLTSVARLVDEKAQVGLFRIEGKVALLELREGHGHGLDRVKLAIVFLESPDLYVR